MRGAAYEYDPEGRAQRRILARILRRKVQRTSQEAAERDNLERRFADSDGGFVRKPRSSLCAESGELCEQGARAAVFDVAADARSHRRYRHWPSLVYWPRIDRRSGDGHYRHRHSLFG